MNVIKLDKRHKFYRYGFTAALRFNVRDTNISKVENYLNSTYGYEPYTHAKKIVHPWVSYTSTRGSWRKKNKIYWVCVKNPAVLSMVLLAIDHTT
jgi:hypothetical protein